MAITYKHYFVIIVFLFEILQLFATLTLVLVITLTGLTSLQVSFAEQILPLLVCLLLSKGSEVCKDIMNRSMCHFFRSHFETSLQVDKGCSTSPLLVVRCEFSVQ
jgi:hypothetical protein